MQETCSSSRCSSSNRPWWLFCAVFFASAVAHFAENVMAHHLPGGFINSSVVYCILSIDNERSFLENMPLNGFAKSGLKHVYASESETYECIHSTHSDSKIEISIRNATTEELHMQSKIFQTFFIIDPGFLPLQSCYTMHLKKQRHSYSYQIQDTNSNLLKR